ncbi:unnamed protein product [Rotaria socialis]|uniref:Dipeptidyl peptidase 3 n=1 Tax=Rotaria socialis TaxID=392032 RepID=A0A821S281_9BILA|nr:unnamed protein product [Rotaria socialis]CAF4849900.1 unnamed protein product [Rotaria socialis]
MTSQHELPLESPILQAKCEEAFSGLNDYEKKYAHYLSRASWWGNMITFYQRSYESPLIFCMLTKLFRSQPLDTIREVAFSKAHFMEDEFTNLIIYYSMLVCNSGNYLGYGDRKFVPSVPKDKLLELIKVSKAYVESPSVMDKLIGLCLEQMYNLDDRNKFLGMPPKAVSMYFTPNCTTEDATLVKEYMVTKGIEAWNTRLLKHEIDGEFIYDIRIASIEKGPKNGLTVEKDFFQGYKMCVSRGDYSFALEKVVKELKKAKNFANSLEQKMLDKYIESFTTGSIKAHKDGSALWVKNKSPPVDTYMGFIEAYADPSNQRAEFESFVVLLNRKQSKKFSILVERAEKEFLPLLPWGPDFEDDVFTMPNFSAFDVLTYATSYLPRGINIPNYKDVKEEVGFKNLTITNAMFARIGAKGGPFLSDSDHQLREKFGAAALEIKVALHELLGHGSGKLLRRKDDGNLNFDPQKVKNPFTGSEVSFYECGQSYQTEFTNVSSAYEECRADAVALYLGLEDDILDIFGVAPKDKEDVKYIIWLDCLYEGLLKLELYQLLQTKWGEAHAQSQYVLLRLALEAGKGLLTIKEVTGDDGLPDLMMTLDRSKISTVGKAATGEFLHKLQIYRSIADSKNGTALFHKYSEVPENGTHPFAKWHEIVVRKNRPKIYLTLPNTRIIGDEVKLISYPDGPAGCISSWIERFSSSDYSLIEENFLNSFESNRQ